MKKGKPSRKKARKKMIHKMRGCIGISGCQTQYHGKSITIKCHPEIAKVLTALEKGSYDDKK